LLGSEGSFLRTGAVSGRRHTLGGGSGAVERNPVKIPAPDNRAN
jgi:hypothetical protein